MARYRLLLLPLPTVNSARPRIFGGRVVVDSLLDLACQLPT